MQNASYKQIHEDYMKNLNGSSLLDTTLVGLAEPFTVYIARSVILSINILPWSLFFNKSRLYSFLIEFSVMVLPLTLCFTVLSSISNIIFIITVAACVTQLCKQYLKQKQQIPQLLSDYLSLKVTDKKRGYITNFRATVNLMTAICILAVDFKIFPRRYAKTENYGYSLMDSGVGLFCMANAIIAPEALGRKKDKTKIASILYAFTSSIPLIILGTARFFTTQQIDYQQHVSEYGVHWNFFITLAVVKIVSSIVLTIVNSQHTLLIGLFLISVHETLLGFGLRDWVLGDTARIDFLSANREGIVSSLGYISVYFLGIAVGQMIQQPRLTVKSNVILEIYLITIASFLWLLNYWCVQQFSISRRLANAGYLTWILAYSVTLIAMYLFVELMLIALIFSRNVKENKSKETSTESLVPELLNAISYNGLFFFLVANLFTGLVNISIHTLNVGKIVSLIIINLYMFTVCFVTMSLYWMKIKLKVW